MEEITKAFQTAWLLFEDLKQAYAKSDSLIEPVIFDLLADVGKIKMRLEKINAALAERG